MTFIITLLHWGLQPVSLVVKNSHELKRAIINARPGTKILLASGEYEGGLFFQNVKGEPNKPIVIEALDPTKPPVIKGGDECLHFSDAAYLELRNLVLVGARYNGLNIDDGGTFETPSHHIKLSGLTVSNIGPKGNCDGIKLSGVTDFHIERCIIERWGDGGQGIDMVGCHNGVIENCTLKFEDDKGYGVQAKGGSSNITIRKCKFEHAGARSVQIGGSTGLQFFRPPLKAGETHAEARNILVEGCTFIGSTAAIAFVGVDGAIVRFNTIYRPKRWAFRILQETRAEGFVPCRNGVVTDNLIVFRSDEWFEGGVNIGPETAPKTFVFARNWWYCLDKPELSRPNLPVPEKEGVYGIDPKLVSPEKGILEVETKSPALKFGAHALPGNS
ncbi:MAG: right-handed parallel beta-helix repeat-containing protein [Armatimonadetes bacterium]|nr:right-handed parallel beta-helix repeat-containing protein [Armatimonadota bacterium]MDW8027290.1 right-handed parallel beta-helix repeat-containing protein [Armatimonadota bacterium]